MFCVVLSVLFLAAEEARPVALVLKVGGAVTRQRGETKVPLNPGGKLLPGDRLSVPRGGEVVLVYFADSHRERVKPGATATVGKQRCGPANAVEVPKVARRLTARNLDKVREIVVGEGASVGVPRDWPPPLETARMTPTYGTRLASLRPSFSWPAVKDADSYKLEVFRSAGRLLWERHGLKKTSLEYPKDAKPLKADIRYSWRVSVTLKNENIEEVVPRSPFYVLPSEDVKALADDPALKVTRDSDPADLMLAAVTYETYGVHDEALRVYEWLAEKAPREALFPLILSRYYKQAGRKDKAREALEQAKKLGYVPPKP